MNRSAVACALAAVVLAGSARAADGGSREGSSKAAPAAASDAGASLSSPPHGQEAREATPHGHGDGMMEPPPEDGTMPDPSIPEGSIEVNVADDHGKPMPNVEVTLGILFNSVAKGESRKRVTRTADALGRARFDGLDIGTGVAYRAMVLRDGATFAIPPFQLAPKNGMRALLHVYPVVSDVSEARIATQAIVYAEVKDDRIQVQQAFRIYNLGRTAWVPNGLVVPLPPTFTAFTAQQGMTDVGVDAVPGEGAKLRGTFAPGQHVVEFRWQLPYSGDAEVKFDVGMTPNLADAQIVTPSSKEMTLSVPGFPSPQVRSDGMGQRALVTEKQMRREEAPVKTVTVVIAGLPTAGFGRVAATILSAAAVISGIFLGTGKKRDSDRKSERAKLLADLEALERAHAKGDVGPKTYERARREIIDDLARLIAAEPKGKTGRAAKKRAAA